MKKTNQKLFSLGFFLISLIAFLPLSNAAPTAIDVTTLANFVGNTTTNTPGTDNGELATGDFNCDGEDDVIIGAGGYSSGKGRIYAIWGGGVLSGSTTLSSTTMDLTITGATTTEAVGSNIVVTDVNVDGCDDIISLAENTSTRLGNITTYYGSTSWSGAYTNGSSVYANKIYMSTVSGQYYDFHLLGALDGDYDSDGDTDSADGFLAVCSDYEEQCYLMPVAEVLDTSGATIEELSSYRAEGYTIAEAITSGDIDNDGYADLIVGDSYDSSADSVTIWFGPLSSSSSDYYDASETPSSYFIAGSVGTTSEDIVIADTQTTAGFGTAVFAEDIYAEDGYDDLVFASTRETVDSNAYSGRMHLISGESIKEFRDTYDLSTTTNFIWYDNGSTYTYDYDDVSHFYYTTGEANVYFGTGSQSSAFHGDLNGDGIKEFLMGAQLYDGANYYGRNYLVYGGAEDVNADTSEDVNLNTDDSAIYYLDGENYNDGLSATVVVADVTGDGLDDMMITADGYDGAEGKLYIYPGAATDLDADGYASAQDDGSGVYTTYDCNDRDAAIYPMTWYLDSDGDGDGSTSSPQVACDQPAGYVANANDCDDSNASTYTSATETCDSVDNNCDGTTDEGVTTTYYLDSDSDGYGSATTTLACSAPSGYVTDSTDCDDSSATASPVGTETCGDSIDQNCDGSDLSCSSVDADSDGLSEDDGDCDDTNATVYPFATEICDSIDNNCDGSTDEGVTTTYYLDSDGDGYGSTTTISACSAPSGYVTDSTDCDDSSATASPVGTETCGDSIDQNCDGSDLSCSSVDADGDSLSADDGDCDDTNATVYPFATETCGDSIDQDCDGSDTTCPAVDADSDGSDATLDCNDSDATVYPGATEINDDGIDQDCDGSDAVTTSTTTDADGDGYDTTTDCDDTNATVYPSALELGDGLDNDCDDRFDERLLTGSITSVPTSVDAGASFDIEYELTNDTGIEDFRVEILVNNSSNSSIYTTAASRGVPMSRAMYTCSATRCTTMDDSTVTLPIGTTTAATTTVTMPATVTSGETYTVRIRVTDDATGQYFTRDLDRVAIN